MTSSFLLCAIAVAVAVMMAAHAETGIEGEVGFLEESSSQVNHIDDNDSKDDRDSKHVASLNEDSIHGCFHVCEASTSTLEEERTCKTDCLSVARTDIYMTAFTKAGLAAEVITTEERDKMWASTPKDSPISKLQLKARRDRYRNNFKLKKCWIKCENNFVESERFDATDDDEEEICRGSCVREFKNRVSKEADRDIIDIHKLFEKGINKTSQSKNDTENAAPAATVFIEESPNGGGVYARIRVITCQPFSVSVPNVELPAKLP